jgi:hypothetical protein
MLGSPVGPAAFLLVVSSVGGVYAEQGVPAFFILVDTGGDYGFDRGLWFAAARNTSSEFGARATRCVKRGGVP